MFYVVADKLCTVEDRLPTRANFRRFWINRDLGVGEVINVVASPGIWPYGCTLLIDNPDPCQRKQPVFNGNVTYLLEEGVALTDVQNALVSAAQDGIQAIQVDNF